MIFATFHFAHLNGFIWQMKTIYLVVSDSLKLWLIWKHLKTIYSKKPFCQQILNPRNASAHDKTTAPTCAGPDTRRCMQDQGIQSNSDFW